eukprot:TRINITY_DN2885_c0_g1_i1.p1 TRINITY_DN2885_c0_g1~~TRINITY_DN2885_c0_g1_i1.p1  ORF type:complete len:242 (-),score=45.45 TRINITY_DN2885_c0_g1_i1:341-1066(-)
MSAMMTVAVAPFVDVRSLRIGNTFLPEGRDHMPRARCHSFSHRTLTHDRHFKPPQLSRKIARSDEEAVTECSSAQRAQKPMLLGRISRGSASGVKAKGGMSCLPAAQPVGKIEQFRVQPQVHGKVTIDDLKAERCDSIDSDDVICHKLEGDNSGRARTSRKLSTWSCSTPSTKAPSSPVHVDENSVEVCPSPSTRQTLASRPQQRSGNRAMKQDELLKQLMQTGASAIARASVMSKEMKQR